MLGTKEQYAARGIRQPDGSFRPVTKAYLSKKKNLLMLEPAMEIDPADGKRKINFETADALFLKNRDPSRFVGQKKNQDFPAAEETYESVKRRQALVKLEQEMMDLAERKDQTLPRAETMAAVSAAFLAIREKLQARNRSLSEQSSTMTDVREINAMLDASDRMLLETVSDEFMRRVSKGGDGTLPAIN